MTWAALDSLQAAWLLLLFCAAPRANYLLRILPPHLTADYAVADDAAVARVSLRSPPAAGLRRPAAGGLGLRSASSDSHAAHWASWCNTVRVISARAPQPASSSGPSAAKSHCHLRHAGFDAPDRATVAAGPTRNWALGMVTSSCVGKTLKTRRAKNPACESSSPRDAGGKSAR